VSANALNRAWYLSLPLLLFSLSASAVSSACELVMFHSPSCEWCQTWEREVGVIYDKTAESRIAPLRRVDVHSRKAADVLTLEPIVYTPTFVLLNGDREVGRITGYPGEDHFWGLLGVLLDKQDAC
jgi:thioredoxin-related protein